MPDPNGELDVSVVICTRNRAEPLRGLLESMTTLSRPAGLHWEVVIVDNGSTDATAAVVAGFTGRLPVVYAREDEPGLSNARNRGVAVARGRYLCWTDDDVQLHAEWLSAYVEAFRQRPEAAVFGGRIYPKLVPPTPPWFAKLLDRWPVSDIVAARDFGDEPLQLDFSRGIVPWGANFAVRAEEQRRHLYDPQLGVSPVQRRSGEEAQVMFEILEAGAVGWWVPGSKVFHIYPPHRQSRRYLREHYFAIGESKAYLDATHVAHFMNRDGREPRLVRRNRAHLLMLIGLNAALYGAFRGLGMTPRSLYHLRRLGLYSGAAAYQRRYGGRTA